ncbi:MAG: hypothetical protein J0M08_10525 [Bacteroidetes bacterium]|nr:hypothetical protein [Bacteroidota bacterium]
MKKIISALLLTTILVFVFNVHTNAQCKAKQIAKSCRGAMKPYYYDGFAESEITIGKKAKKQEIEFTAFGKQKYKLIFCTSGFPENVSINIYDKGKTKPNRTKVYSNESINKAEWVVAPAKTTTYYIEYDIPEGTSAPRKECVIMLIGFDEKSAVGYGDDE